ncbi:MAG: hypothetical protein Q8Q05_03180 [bacterium]|nr:hypothetical protein [bacterium]
MAERSLRYWQIRAGQSLSNATGLDFLLVLLLVCLLYLIGRTWVGSTIESPAVILLTIINVGLAVGILALWVKLLWRLPFWLAIGSLILTTWWLTTSPIISTLLEHTVQSEIYPLLLVTLTGLGGLGAISAIAQLTNSNGSGCPSKYWLVLNHKSPLPSYSGLGSLVIMGFLRILRDRIFVAVLILLTLMLLAKISGWTVPGSWLQIVIAGIMTLSVMISLKLGPLASSLLTKFPSLPTTKGAIDFAVGITSLVIVAAVSWTILFGLLGLTAADTLWLTGIFLVGQIGITLIARSARESVDLGLLGSWWIVIIQLAALAIIYQIMWQFNLSGVMLLLLVGLSLFVALTSYQESTHSATISPTW